MGVPPNVHLLQAALAAQNPGAAMAPVPEPPPAVRAMDVVWSVNNPDDRGLVWRVAGETDSEGDDSEYEDEEDYIPPGHARVTWLGGAAEQHAEVRQLRVADRALVAGAIVAPVGTPLGQTGQVTAVQVSVDVRDGAGAMHYGVSSTRLARVHPFAPGHFVVGGAWVGRIDAIEHNLVIAFDNGMVVRLVGEAADDSLAIWPTDARDQDFLDDDHYHLYLGQRVCVAGSRSFERSPDVEVLAPAGSAPARTPTPLERASMEQAQRTEAGPGELLGTIIDLQPSGIGVIWSTAAHSDVVDEEVLEPPDFVSPALLRPLPSGLGTAWHLGDRALLLPAGSPPYPQLAAAWPDVSGTQEVGDGDDASGPAASEGADAGGDVGAEDTEAQPLTDVDAEAAPGPDGPRSRGDRAARKRGRGGSAGSAGGRRRSLPRNRAEPLQREVARPYGGTMVQVVGTRTTVDVQWQDGSRAEAAPARGFLPVSFHDEHDFAAGDFVELRDPFADMDESPGDGASQPPQAAKRFGWVRHVNAAGRTANVAWADGGADSEHSVYQLQVHPDFQFAIGDVVLRLPEATVVQPGAATSAAASAMLPAASTDATVAAGQPPVTEEGMADAAAPPETASAAAAAAAATAAAPVDTESPSATGVAAEAGASAAFQVAGASAQQRPAPKTRAAQRAEWTEVRNRQRIYYYNTRTGESVWDKPDVLKTVQELAGDSVGWRSYTLWPAEAGAGELPHAHYWHHPATGETTWEMPEQVRAAHAAAQKRQQEQALESGALDADPDALSRIGEVLLVAGGGVDVLWADGTRSTAQPQQLFVVSGDDDMGGPDDGASHGSMSETDGSVESGSGSGASSGWVTDDMDATDSEAEGRASAGLRMEGRAHVSMPEERAGNQSTAPTSAAAAAEDICQPDEPVRYPYLDDLASEMASGDGSHPAFSFQHYLGAMAARDLMHAAPPQDPSAPPLPAVPPPPLALPPQGLPPAWRGMPREYMERLIGTAVLEGMPEGASVAGGDRDPNAESPSGSPGLQSRLHRLFTRLFSWDDGGGSAEGRNSEAAAAVPDPAGASDAAAPDAAASQHDELFSSGGLPSRPPDCVFTLGGPGGGAGDAATVADATAEAATDSGRQQPTSSAAEEMSALGSAPGTRAALSSSSPPSSDQPPAAAADAATPVQQRMAAAVPTAAGGGPAETPPAASVTAASAPTADATPSPAEPTTKPTTAPADTAAAPAAAAPAAGSGQASYSFSQFEVADDPVDHHFARETRQPENPRAFAKRVRREWEALRQLPPAIWVRAYESRTDLFRAAMAGPAGTPYHDGLFFFDIKLPPGYPATPPQVWYRSWGLRVNPNLYENGYVCLSLLNTWNGRAHECWNPEASTLLQVLVSIQGLVLVPEPYYNEAGYGRQVGSAGGARNSAVYNENAFLLSARSMVHCTRQPPPDFRPLMQEHFTQRRGAILQACDAYAAGSCPIGHAGPDADVAVAAAERRQQEAAAHASTGGASAGTGVSSGSGSGGDQPLANGNASAAAPPAGNSGDPTVASAAPGAGGPAAATSEGFRLVLAQLRPRLEAALDSVSAA